MIIPMKKVSLLCLGSDKEATLQALQNLGVMHLTSQLIDDSVDRREIRDKIDTLLRLVGILKVREKGAREAPLAMESGELADYARTVIQGHDEIAKAITEVEQEIARLAPWGDFNWDQLEQLKNRGIYVYLCESPRSKLEELRAGGEFEMIEELWVRDNQAGFVIVSFEDLSGRELPLAFLPDKRLARLELRRRELQAMSIALEQDLDELVASVPKLTRHIEELRNRYDFMTARDSMERADDLVLLLDGFVPEPAVPALEQAALDHGWALEITDPGPDDRPPVLLKQSKFSRLVKPLFGFLGIVPGYSEIDISAGVLFFFTIYFGMIINDAGYGALFLALALVGLHKTKDQPALKLPLLLLTLLSAVAIIWGALNGSYFGLTFGGLRWLTDEAGRNNHIQLICFVLGLSQLVIGRLWQAARTPSIRSKIGHIGWALMLCGNFIIVLKLLGLAELPAWTETLMFVFYGAGLLLVIAGAVNWLDVADVFQFPFSIINSFVDLLSYIRLFAVGLAGYYIALNFNEMGAGLIKMGWVMILPGSVVILFGHALNICLCLMGVLVHGVRLNTLEFSNHVGVTWSGVEFKPLANAGREQEF